MNIVTKILFCSLFLVLIGGAIWLFPKKIRLLNRVGLDKTNADLIHLAKSGDKEAINLYRKSKVILGIAVCIGLALSLAPAIFR